MAVGGDLPAGGAVPLTESEIEAMTGEELFRWAEDELGVFLDPNLEKGAMLVRLYALAVPE